MQALVQQRIPQATVMKCCFSFIAKFDVQPWDLTHQGGYLSLSSPSVYVTFYNTKNVKEFGIVIVSQCSILFPETLPCVHAYHLFYGFGNARICSTVLMRRGCCHSSGHQDLKRYFTLTITFPF